ncbi:hypothetical protein [Aeromicrobium wangtongii]|uniref:Integral membrane protein n=1 Tax=Aeromicrobium wangtongii TaxID=2969247 RepID=A0ABY5M242_9ACTN|nr:hypothetical protein [Aeromicrobium wangtongii]MCD9198223.1 hypothetical protein [Aeromicrobium wangtongii]UUP12259.1 hypothetical protein NQV15_10345 [Aeromicrobium wangtongii]
MSTTETSTNHIAAALRKLYFVRFGFAIIWAILIFATASDIGPVSGTLLILYPLFDVAAAIVDLRASRTTRPPLGLYVNVALSTATAIALAFAVSSGIPDVLRVWGVWAITAGIVQLVVAVPRRRLGGQVPMFLSGGISVLAGGAFIAGASADDPSLTNIGGYATLGGIFFLVSALRLGRTAGAK